MPLVSQERIDSAMNVLLTGNYATKRDMLRETPISPPDGDTSMFTKAQLTGAAHHFTKLKITDVNDMICFLKLRAVESIFVGAMTFETKFPRDLPRVADRAGWVPCWFLPWSSGRIIKLKIPDVGASPTINFGPGIDPVANPGLFFTAGINGCSVFAVGAAGNPSVYHGGITPGALTMPLQPNETTEAAWTRLLGRVGTLAKPLGSVGKTDYVSELNNPAGTDDTDRVRSPRGLKLKTTRLADALETTLQSKGNLTKLEVVPWGAVFGLRDPGTGSWSMTLVKNSTVTYLRLVQTVTKRFLRKDRVVTTERGENRGAQLDMPVSLSLNLGFQDFFPGAGVVTVRNIDTSQIF